MVDINYVTDKKKETKVIVRNKSKRQLSEMKKKVLGYGYNKEKASWNQ